MDNLMVSAVLSMSGLAILFAAILAFADKKLKVQDEPKVDEIVHLLPGVNCGACGALSCHDFAERIVHNGEDPNKCRVASQDNREKICQIMGEAMGEVFPKLPLVKCACETGNKKMSAEYNGIKTCGAANLDFGGGMQCQYGCMGFGDCTKVCPFDALHMVNGLPRVDAQKCTGCGKCAEACPRNIIEMQEKKNGRLFYVACTSTDTGVRVRQVCGVGCIGCGICVKLSKENFFSMENNLSKADYSKQTEQNIEEVALLAGKCPTKVIKEI